MSSFVINGGRPINGDISPSGNKNEALPALAACLLTDEPVILRRVPKIHDVVTMCQILDQLGVKTEWLGKDSLKIQADKLTDNPVDGELSAKIRASILLLGPLLARFRKVQMPMPGGDVIGARRMDTHFEGIEALGGQVDLDGRIDASLPKRLTDTHVYLDEPSVTGTENLLLMTVISKSRTTIHNAAAEPHVVGLCNLLNAMGADIQGVGSNRLEVFGVPVLRGCSHEIGPDFMEVGSYLCLGAIGGGKLRISNVNIDDLRFTLKTFRRIGINPEIESNSLLIDGTRPLEMTPDMSGRVSTIYSGPWPAFPTDLMSTAIVAATQATGTLIFHEKMFEGRMFFTDKLMSMGANIVLCDPHRVVVTGPAALSGSRMSSPDVRAGMAMVVAAIVAKGQSVIHNIYQVERGYCDIVEKLGSIGADITVSQQ